MAELTSSSEGEDAYCIRTGLKFNRGLKARADETVEAACNSMLGNILPPVESNQPGVRHDVEPPKPQTGRRSVKTLEGGGLPNAVVLATRRIYLPR